MTPFFVTFWLGQHMDYQNPNPWAQWSSSLHAVVSPSSKKNALPFLCLSPRPLNHCKSLTLFTPLASDSSVSISSILSISWYMYACMNISMYFTTIVTNIYMGLLDFQFPLTILCFVWFWNVRWISFFFFYFADFFRRRSKKWKV